MITLLDISNSKGFALLGIDDKNRIRAIFKDNTKLRYAYLNVSEEKLEGLRQAEKKGSYFFKNIRHDETIICKPY